MCIRKIVLYMVFAQADFSGMFSIKTHHLCRKKYKITLESVFSSHFLPLSDPQLSQQKSTNFVQRSTYPFVDFVEIFIVNLTSLGSSVPKINKN